MNKSGTARFLMTVTILLIIAFQAYWLNKLYREEDNNFRKSIDLIFRESMYRLQAERFKNDSTGFHKVLGDNLFMTDLISSVVNDGKKTGDSAKRKVTISLRRDATFTGDNVMDSFKRDTVVYLHPSENNMEPQHIEKLFENSKALNDTIPVKKIDSLYHNLLAKEGISVDYNIQLFRSFVNDGATSLYLTRKVPVGLLKPVFYQASFHEPGWYIFKKIRIQVFLSLLLIGLTTLSFVFIYRSLLAQRRLTAIKNEFINNITHELKTPLATVNVAIEALRNFGGLDSLERTKEYLDISALELQRLSMLVDKVLKLSMFENKQIKLEKERFNLLQLIRELMSSMKLQFDKQHAAILLEVTGDNFVIEADRLHIASVIYNLLDNALKYSKENSHIGIHLLDRNDYLELRVSDNGIGIAEEYRKKVFEQFFRVPEGDRHNIKGYGLGLSYVNYIVKRHMGFIELESAPGKGSTFIIKLPFSETPVIRYDRGRIIRKIAWKL